MNITESLRLHWNELQPRYSKTAPLLLKIFGYVQYYRAYIAGLSTGHHYFNRVKNHSGRFRGNNQLRNQEEPSSQTSGIFLPIDSKRGATSTAGMTHDKMGFVFSKIAKHISPKPFAAHCSIGVKAATDSHDDRISPEPGEIPRSPDSIFGLNCATTNDVRNESNFLWPYVSTTAPQDDLESGYPLKLRRPALYEEYWAHEPRSVA